MSVTIPVSWGELFDKISILSIKNNRIADSGKLKNIHRELDLLCSIRDEQVEMTSKLQILCNLLLEINEKLWNIEDDIRICEKHNEFNDRFLELARSVYLTNDKRSDIKAQINRLLNSDVVEEKSYQDY